MAKRIGKVSDWQTAQNYQISGINLKPMQSAIINCSQNNDVLVNLPTGFGKSLLFQYPASKLDNMTIVVFVPLRALLWDCLKEAKLLDIFASQLDDKMIVNYSRNGVLPKLLFLTPEKMFQNYKAKAFLENLHQQKKIKKIVIDEVHCISEWGSDFRPDYNNLQKLKEMFPFVKIMGMSATIPPEAINDLVQKLIIPHCYYFQSSSNRPNLVYEVRKGEKKSLDDNICGYIEEKKLEEECGIIYCQTIKSAEEIYKLLKKNLNCQIFHSKLAESKRAKTFQRFMAGDIKIMIATICFGMGVNKKNIRFVINVGISMSVEAYYQESGRAGRDGLLSYCLLLTYPQDTSALNFLIQKTTKKKTLMRRRLFKVEQIKSFTKAKGCRKRQLFKLLGEDFAVQQCKKTCDYCNQEKEIEVFYKANYTEKAKRIVEELQQSCIVLTRTQLFNMLKGKDPKIKIPIQKYENLKGFLKYQKQQDIQTLIDTLLEKGMLKIQTQIKKLGKFNRSISYLKACSYADLRKVQEVIVEMKIQNKNNHVSVNKKSATFDRYLSKKFSEDQVFQFKQDKVEQKKEGKAIFEQDEDLQEIKMIPISEENSEFYMETYIDKDPEGYEKIKRSSTPDIFQFPELNEFQSEEQPIEEEIETKIYNLDCQEINQSSNTVTMVQANSNTVTMVQPLVTQDEELEMFIDKIMREKDKEKKKKDLVIRKFVDQKDFL